ncbi:MAG: hypothetical protein A2166_01135 [Omnitrophica WOR_2 bacterium RBG_13_41_10]|nr:MAG: hypothetical protein A2166_01135 [Omnitrophica WOR_2 bacterium RBG_13_41_10]
MKKVILLALSLVLIVPVFGQEAPKNNVVAYYFHGNFRCFNCYRIEQYSKEAIEQYFKDELSSGKLVFKIINIEEKNNEHFIKDYQLYTKSLIISLVKDGEEVKFDNLVKVWEFLGNKQKFYDYVKDEITQYLKEL